MAKTRRDVLTPKQGAFVKAVKASVKKNGMPTTAVLNQAAASAYDLSNCTNPERAASAMAGQLLNMPKVRKALGFESDEMKGFVTETIMQNIKGQNPLWPKDRDLHRDAVKIAARLTFPETTKIINSTEDKYADKSTADLLFCRDHGHWPDEEPDEFSDCDCKPKGPTQ